MNTNKKVESFMDDFIDSPCEQNIDFEYFEIEKQYELMFNHSVPCEMLPDSITSEQIKKAMRQCIEIQKDILFKLLNVNINESYLY